MASESDLFLWMVVKSGKVLVFVGFSDAKYL